MASGAASLLLKNANIITCAQNKPRTNAVGVFGDRILRTGTSDHIESFRDVSTLVIDCEGRTVVPGFIDAHCHIQAYISSLLNVDLSARKCSSIAAIIEALKQKAAVTPPGQWVRGDGYNEFYLAEKRHPVRQDLDRAARDHPVIISHRSRHGSVLNSLGLNMLGITNETEEPDGGLIDRDLDSGQPNGRLFEMDNFIDQKIQLNVRPQEWERALTQANGNYLSQGITSLCDASSTNDYTAWEKFRAIKSSQQLFSRISMMLGLKSLPDFAASNLITGNGDENLKIGAVKIIVSQARGDVMPPQNELNQSVKKALDAGYQVAIHAVTRDEIGAAVTAFEAAAAKVPPSRWIDKRHRIEHCSECHPDLIRTLAKQKAVVVSQPGFIYFSGERYLSQVPRDTLPWLYPFRSILNNGIPLAASSDSPIEGNNPLLGIYAAITRQSQSGQKLSESEAITLEQALNLYTRSAAFASFDEANRGSISEGKLADLVILSQDPVAWLQAHKEASGQDFIDNVFVEMTIIGGKIVYSKF